MVKRHNECRKSYSMTKSIVCISVVNNLNCEFPMGLKTMDALVTVCLPVLCPYIATQLFSVLL